MASISANGSRGNHKFTLTVTEGAASNENNTSPVAFTFKLSPVNTTWAWSSWGDSISYTISIKSGSTVLGSYSGSIPAYDGYATVTLKSGTLTVKHDDNGDKTVSYSFSVDDAAGQRYTPGDASASGSLKLATIPRASVMDSLACSTSYLTGTLTYKYTPKSASYYNRCNISLDLDGTYIAIRSVLIGKKAATQQSGTITFSDTELSNIYKQLPSATKGTIRFTLRTYSDSEYSSQVGSADYQDIELSIPTTVKPSAALSATMVNENTWIAGKNIYVAGYSKVKLALTAEAGTGASVKSKTISGDGFSYNTTPVTVQLAGPGDFTFVGKATDTRGRSSSDSETITVLPYSIPAITSMRAARGTYDSESGWTADEKGSDVRLVFKTRISLADNGNVYGVSFKLDGSTITPDYGTTSGLQSEDSRTVYFFGVESEASHVLVMTTTDSVGKYQNGQIIVPTTLVTVEYKANGKGVAFGKTSEKDAFECAWDAYFSKNLYIPNNSAYRAYIADGSDTVNLIKITDNNNIVIGDTTNSKNAGVYIGGVYGNTSTSAANVFVSESHKVYRSSSSSKRYKTDVRDIEAAELDPRRLLDLPVREFKYSDGYLVKGDPRAGVSVPGFIAEEMDEIYPIACEHDASGQPEDWNIRFLVPAMLKLIQDQQKEINELKGLLK